LIDGTGNPWVKSDVAVKGERIVNIGDLSGVQAGNIIDAKGLVVSPGFFDVHAHTDYQVLSCPGADSRIAQGITTDVSGNCGFSVGPYGKKWQIDWWVANKPRDEKGETIWVTSWPEGKKIVEDELGIELSWRTVGEYLGLVEEQGVGVNYCQLVGHHVLRAAVMGEVIPKPEKEELDEMKALLDAAMQEGAFGVSCGFDIKHEVDTSEFIELGKVVAKYDGVFANHIRSLGDDVIPAVKEAIEIAEKSNVRTTISHLLVSGKPNWGKGGTALSLIDDARSRGLEIFLDQIPFKMGEGNFYNPDLDRFLPDWACEGGSEKLVERLKDPEIRSKIKEEMEQGITNKRYTAERYPLKKKPKKTLWEDMLTITFCGENKIYEGKTIAEVSRMMGVDPHDAILDLIVTEGTDVKAVSFGVSDEDLVKIMRYPHTMFGSDGGIIEAIKRPGIPHPRQYGTFPRVLGVYVRGRGVLTLEDAIRRMTSLPAQFLRIRDRGLLREGMHADITVFDPKKIIDISNVTETPSRYADGIEYVLVNGKMAIEKGKYTGALAGKVLRHQASV
jgi:N-acyl-D-amino-acid deacylase